MEERGGTERGYRFAKDSKIAKKKMPTPLKTHSMKDPIPKINVSFLHQHPGPLTVTR